MEAARKAVGKITGRTGHTTEVDEIVKPAITRETVKPHRHEEVTEAIDKEVHQDHYHTTVQPITATETLPEKHSHNILPTKEKEYVHGDAKAVKSKVAAELGQFKSTSSTLATKETSSAAAAVTGEHVHHHVHETVQPVIHKETIQPEVVHTTMPVHAVHHEAAQHHGMSQLPTKTLEEFKKTGGTLTGTQKHAHEEYAGAPRPYNTSMQTTSDKVMNGVTGAGKQNTTTKTTDTYTDNYAPSHRKADSGVDVSKKGGFFNKLNPKTDADHDGKVGVFD